MMMPRAGVTVMAVLALAACSPPEDTAERELQLRPGEIYHLGIVVEDLDAAMAEWSSGRGVGPFFVAREFVFENPDYRGEAVAPKVSLAFAYEGTMMIELIEPLDDTPSPYRELIDRSGFGFHHLGYLSDDVDASVVRMEEKGYDCLFRADFAGGRLAYCEAGDLLGTGVIEFVQRSPDVEALLEVLYQAARDWDGSEPVRPLM